jgi:hypothetical protein
MDVSVPASYADGDHIKCGACDTQHRIARTNESLRLVIADVAPLRDALRLNEQHRQRLETELAEAYASWGIGINGFLVGLLYIVAKIALEDRPLDASLVMTAVVLSVVVGGLLELTNFFFLQKRKAIERLTADIATLSDEARDLQRKIRESNRR